MKIPALAILGLGSQAKHQCVEEDSPESNVTHVFREPKEKNVLSKKPRATHTQHKLEDTNSTVPPQGLRNYLIV